MLEAHTSRPGSRCGAQAAAAHTHTISRRPRMNTEIKGYWFPVQLDPNRPTLLQLADRIRVPMDEVDSFLDPSLGEPWDDHDDL
jgi:hypothetical protein